MYTYATYNNAQAIIDLSDVFIICRLCLLSLSLWWNQKHQTVRVTLIHRISKHTDLQAKQYLTMEQIDRWHNG